MSVEYQTWKDAVATFKEDTHNMSSNLNTGVKYYAHLFSLLNIQVCGYVHPLILTYFTEFWAGHIALHRAHTSILWRVELPQTVQQGCNLNVMQSSSLLKRRLSIDTNLPKISNANMLFDSVKFVRFKPRKSPAECVDGPVVLHPLQKVC